MKAWTRNCFAPILVLAAMLLSLSARADYVQCDTSIVAGAPLQSLLKGSSGDRLSVHNTQLVWGTSLDVSSLSLPSSGQLTVRLRDIGFPEALSSLKVLVTDLNGIWQQFDALASGGSLLATVNVPGPTQLFAVVYAHSARGTLGLYDFRATFSPVPLPAAAWLLLSGLAGLGVLRKRRPAASL